METSTSSTGPTVKRDGDDRFPDEELQSDISLSDDESDEEDLDAIRPTRCALGLNRNYVRGWARRDGFREFYQNWRDAIVQSFDLDPRDPASFRPKWSTTANEIRITVHREVEQPNGGTREELLGFIRLNKKAGSLELANFSAQLEMRHLSLGGTDKHANNKLAGIHGEGFKLAALVMRRNGHGVRISSSSFYWNFGFNGTYRDRFYCQLSKPAQTTLQKNVDLHARQLALGPRTQLTPFIFKDVLVKISKARGLEGHKVTEEDFRRWAKVALELSDPPPEDVFRTEHGDLILDPRFSSQVYLKGLKVSSHAPNGRPYVFAYNFAYGQINRDRERLTKPKTEAEMLAKIWEKPILENHEGVIQRYVELFRTTDNAPDIAFAEIVVSEAVALRMWKMLRTGKEDAFFYYEDEVHGEDAVDQANIIVSTLKKRPEAISMVLWKTLRQYALIRTPQEERLHLFVSSQQIEVPDESFSINIYRLLKSALQLDSRLESIQVHIVKGGGTGIDLLFEEDKGCLLIHEKWIDFTKAHENTSCEIALLARDRPLHDVPFSCDHIVEDLFELVINDVRRALKFSHAEASTIRGFVRERIPQMPREIKVIAPNEAGVLEVTWKGNESGVIAENYGREIEYYVTLHKMSSCATKKSDLIQLYDAVGPDLALCSCPHQIVNRETSVATFRGLQSTEFYFPMVARKGTQTLFGISPLPIKPRANITARASEVSRRPANLLHTRPPQAATSPNSIRDLDGHQSDDPEDWEESTSLPGLSIDVEPEPPGPDNLQATLQDEATWRLWDKEVLPSIASKLFHPNLRKEPCKFVDRFSSYSLVCQRLGCTFERDTYFEFKDNQDEPMKYVALIQEIHSGADRCDSKSPHFIVTKYSYVEDEPFLSNQARENNAADLIIQHSGPEPMGSRSAGEVIEIDDIAEATIFPEDFEVIYCLQRPTDLTGDSKMFCWLARWATGVTTIFSPPAEKLLPRADRRKLDGFIDDACISVMDLTPSVLGPLEGFKQGARSQVFAGVGFDENRHYTWRMMNPGCRVFDGSLELLLDDIRSGAIHCPDEVPPGNPKVAIVAGENSIFRLTPEATSMPSEQEFLTPLDLLDMASRSFFQPDFLVLTMPASVLHQSTIGRLSIAIERLRDLRNLVQISLQPLSNYGILQKRWSLVLIASPYPGLGLFSVGRARADRADTTERTSTRVVRDIIGDLEFSNPRESRRFVCSSAPTRDGAAGHLPRNIYNHYTGKTSLGHFSVVDMNASSVSLSCKLTDLKHPTRNDLLSVRELARLQGFNDSILFYGSHELQRRDVLSAQPPSLTSVIAKIIGLVVGLQRKRQLGDTNNIAQAAKRPRLETAVSNS